MKAELLEIGRKIRSGRRLSYEDGLALLRSTDLAEIGRLADKVRRRLHGTRTFYNINRHINYSNICTMACRFCDFWRKRGGDGAYQLSIEQVAEQTRTAFLAGATEIHMVGGLHPDLPYGYYIDLLKAMRQAAPGIHIKAFTAIEIVHIAKIAGRETDLDSVLNEMKNAGLNSLPGGGAEVFSDVVFNNTCRRKPRYPLWFQVHKTAHQLGIPSNATILYGHMESDEQRIEHLMMLRQAQDETIKANLPTRFQAIIPLPFIPGESNLKHLPGPTGLDDLKMLATCRLMLDNFDHVKAFWVMQGTTLSQVALHYGVDDLDGTVQQYDIVDTGDDRRSFDLSVGQLRAMILGAGMIPVERNSLYQEKRRPEAVTLPAGVE